MGSDYLAIAAFGYGRRNLLISALEEDGYPLAGLARRAQDKVMSIVYPQPGFSASGAIAAWAVNRVVPEADRAVVHATFDGSVSALLCRLRGESQGDAQESDWGSVVALVPSHTLDDYNHGGNLGREDCPKGSRSGKYELTAFSSKDLPKLDYPFVKINWPWTDDPARQRALDDFADWLADNTLFDETPTDGDPPSITDWQTENWQEEWKGVARSGNPMNLQIMLDGSGSMSRSPIASFSAVHDALAEVRQILKDEDKVTLGKFFARAGGDGQVVMVSGDQNDQDVLGRLLHRLALDDQSGFDQSISDMLKKLEKLKKLKKSDGPAESVAVITDGGLFNDEPEPANAGKSIRKALDEAVRPRNLYILTLGGRCPKGLAKPAPPAATALARDAAPTAKNVVCDDSAGKDVAEALGRMIAQIREWS